MNANWFKRKVKKLGDIKTVINMIEEKYAPERADLNSKKKTLQDSYNLDLKPHLKDKATFEEEIQSWVLETREKERALEEETGRIVPSAVVEIEDFGITDTTKIGEVDLTKVPIEYLILNEAKVKSERKKNESLEIPGVQWRTSLIFTHKNLGGQQ